MKRLILLAAGLSLCYGLAAVQHKGSHISSVSMNDDNLSDDCTERLRVSNDDFRTSVRDEETRSLPNQPLSISAEHNGGIRVTTWDKPDFALKLCKQVSVDDEAEGRRLLAETKIVVEGGHVSISAPESDDHYSLGTLLLVKAPRNAKLDLRVFNGGVSLTNFTGTATAHAHNGGIALRRSTGKLSLDAQNGGLVLVVPKNMTSGVEVSGSNYTSIICKGDACDGAERTWDSRGRILRFGGSNPQIRATTVNGGIVVEAPGHQRGEL